MPPLSLQILPKKRKQVAYLLVETNLFVCFLEEFTAWQFAFEINQPLAMGKSYVFRKNEYYLDLRCNKYNEWTHCTHTYLLSYDMIHIL